MSEPTKPENPPVLHFKLKADRIDEYFGEVGYESSVTLRDLFAAFALTAVSAPANYHTGPCNAAIAERAYLIADAMLRERSKR